MVSQFRHLTVTSEAFSFSGLTQCSVCQKSKDTEGKWLRACGILPNQAYFILTANCWDVSMVVQVDVKVPEHIFTHRQQPLQTLVWFPVCLDWLSPKQLNTHPWVPTKTTTEEPHVPQCGSSPKYKCFVLTDNIVSTGQRIGHFVARSHAPTPSSANAEVSHFPWREVSAAEHTPNQSRRQSSTVKQLISVTKAQ